MWEFFKIAQLVLQLMPAVVAAIKAVEEAIPGEGNGERKLAVIRETLEEIYVQTTTHNIAFEKIWNVLVVQIAAIVSALNESGVFKKENS